MDIAFAIRETPTKAYDHSKLILKSILVNIRCKKNPRRIRPGVGGG